MTILAWSDDLDVGVEAMNNQHKILLGLMNNLHDLFLKKESFDKQLPILAELEKMTILHFKNEEAHMEKVMFEGLTTHKIIHQQLLSQLTEHKNKILQNKIIHSDFFDFLAMWLRAHIIGIDKKYSAKK